MLLLLELGIKRGPDETQSLSSQIFQSSGRLKILNNKELQSIVVPISILWNK